MNQSTQQGQTPNEERLKEIAETEGRKYAHEILPSGPITPIAKMVQNFSRGFIAGIKSDAAKEYWQQSRVTGEGRFKKPTDDQVVKMAIVVNDGKIEQEKLTDMVTLADMIIDRLYENGDILIPSSKENEINETD